MIDNALLRLDSAMIGLRIDKETLQQSKEGLLSVWALGNIVEAAEILVKIISIDKGVGPEAQRRRLDVVTADMNYVTDFMEGSDNGHV